MSDVKILPSKLNFEVWKGDDFDVTLEVVSVVGTTEEPIDFTDYEAEMVFEAPGTDTAALTVDSDTEITFPDTGKIRVEIAGTVLASELLVGKYEYRIRLTDSGGKKRTYFAGDFKMMYK